MWMFNETLQRSPRGEESGESSSLTAKFFGFRRQSSTLSINAQERGSREEEDGRMKQGNFLKGFS